MKLYCYLFYNEKQQSWFYEYQNEFYFLNGKLKIHVFQMHAQTVLQMEAIQLQLVDKKYYV